MLSNQVLEHDERPIDNLLDIHACELGDSTSTSFDGGTKPCDSLDEFSTTYSSTSDSEEYRSNQRSRHNHADLHTTSSVTSPDRESRD